MPPIHHIYTPHSEVCIRMLSLVRLTLANLLDRTLLIDMNVEALGLVVHRAHTVGLEDTVFLGEVGLCERLG
jgi:hypothetical protein